MQKCKVCKQSFMVTHPINDFGGCTDIAASFCPVCGAAQPNVDGSTSGMLRIGSHMWRVHIHPEFSTYDIEFRDGAGNTLVIMRSVGQKGKGK